MDINLGRTLSPVFIVCVGKFIRARVRPENRRRGFEGAKYIIMGALWGQNYAAPIRVIILIGKWGKSFFNV
jgi:hypothetical protein